jgi:hypothetical protein
MKAKNQNLNGPANLRICYDRVVPDEVHPANAASQAAAAEHHIREIHARARAAGLDPAAVIHVARMAVSLTKKWENGRQLKCRFLDGSATQRKKVEDKAHIWEQYANISFKFGSSSDAEIRISFGADSGSWSAVGTDCLIERYFPKYQPTMNFGWLEDDTEDPEYERVVVHEFGHALGCVHEHQSPKAHLQWNKQKVYQVFSGPPNYWSKADIDHNILQKYSQKGMAETAFDDRSIMLYQFDAALFKNRKPTPENFQLSDHDKQFINQMYPKSKHHPPGGSVVVARRR